MSLLIKTYSGRALYNGWMLRKRLAETRRPRMVKILAGLVALAGLAVAVEGTMAGGPESGVPGRRRRGTGTALLFVLCVSGLNAAGSLVGRRRWSAKATLGFIAGLLVSGAAMLADGVRRENGRLAAAGSFNLTAASALAVLLGLAWYTLDPLGLHWHDGT